MNDIAIMLKKRLSRIMHCAEWSSHVVIFEDAVVIVVIIAYIRLFMLLLLHNFSFLMNNFMQIIEII